jgi:hypothetical protein
MTHTTARRLVCNSGHIVAKVGDRFVDDRLTWEIVAFPDRWIYSGKHIGGTRIVTCRPVSELPQWWQQYQNEDGTVDWCGNSVAVRLLARSLRMEIYDAPD